MTNSYPRLRIPSQNFKYTNIDGSTDLVASAEVVLDPSGSDPIQDTPY